MRYRLSSFPTLYQGQTTVWQIPRQEKHHICFWEKITAAVICMWRLLVRSCTCKPVTQIWFCTLCQERKGGGAALWSICFPRWLYRSFKVLTLESELWKNLKHVTPYLLIVAPWLLLQPRMEQLFTPGSQILCFKATALWFYSKWSSAGFLLGG